VRIAFGAEQALRPDGRRAVATVPPPQPQRPADRVGSIPLVTARTAPVGQLVLGPPGASDVASLAGAAALQAISWDDFNRTAEQCGRRCRPYSYPCTRTRCRACCCIKGSAGCVKSGTYCWQEQTTCQGCNWVYECWTYRVPLPDGDLIDLEIREAAADPAVVDFVLVLSGNVTWKKILNMPDGQGSSWDIIAEGRNASASNGLWAQQVHNGQVLTFSKAKTFGWMTPVYTLGGLERLRPGTRVTFTWVKD
jgi:hypothetical protein